MTKRTCSKCWHPAPRGTKMLTWTSETNTSPMCVRCVAEIFGRNSAVVKMLVK